MRHLVVILLLLIFSTANIDAKNVGVFFGTFNPPHIGHLNIANKAIKIFKLEALYMLPNYKPIHKPNALSFQHRYNMVNLVTVHEKKFKLLDKSKFLLAHIQACEKNNRNAYYEELIEIVKSLYKPNDTFYQVIGADSFNGLVQRNILSEISKTRVIAVFSRPGYEINETPEVTKLRSGGKVVITSFDQKRISSTSIRKRIRSGESMLESDLPKYIMKYIRNNKLYQSERKHPSKSSENGSFLQPSQTKVVITYLAYSGVGFLTCYRVTLADLLRKKL